MSKAERLREELRKIKEANPGVRFWQDLPMRERNTYLALIELLDLETSRTTPE